MKTFIGRTMVALGTLVSLASSAAAQGYGYMGGPGGQQGWNAGPGVQQIAYSEGGAEQYPAELAEGGYSGGYSYDQCSGGGCSGCDGYCGGGCCGDSGCYGGDCCQGGCDCTNYCGDCGCNGNMHAGMCYAEIQNLFLRPHVNDQVVGKLREKYEWSPRAVVGYEAPSGLGARGRYWNYTRTTTTVDDTDSLRLDWDVIDVEGTSRFSTRHGDIVVGGGFRWADLKIVDSNDDEVDADMPGITFAIDGRSVICRGCRAEVAGVVGARWSLLGGDWEGDNNILAETFDDNVTAQELYGGFELVCHKNNCDLFARVVFEMQNWHSDAINENTDASIGFVGPAIHGGITY
jgi:hypothetical protein